MRGSFGATRTSMREVAEPGAVLVGLLRDVEYQNGRTVLAPGDAVVLYTDGVTEAMNPEQEFFTEDRLRQVLGTASRHTPKQMVRTVLQAVDAFGGGAPQADDVTVLAMRYRGKPLGPPVQPLSGVERRPLRLDVRQVLLFLVVEVIQGHGPGVFPSLFLVRLAGALDGYTGTLDKDAVFVKIRRHQECQVVVRSFDAVKGSKHTV